MNSECSNDLIYSAWQQLNSLNSKRLLEILQKLAVSDFSLLSPTALQSLISAIWQHEVLLDDCILVSGIIFCKLNHQKLRIVDNDTVFVDLLNLANLPSQNYPDWVEMSLVRGLVMSKADCMSIAIASSLTSSTLSAIKASLPANKSQLLSHLLENLLQIFKAESSASCYNPSSGEKLILGLTERLLLSNSDLVQYKCRDLVKWHIQLLINSSLPAFSTFFASLVETFPASSKIALQIFEFILGFDVLPSPNFIFSYACVCLCVKGLSSSAASCLVKVLKLGPDDKSPFINELITTITSYEQSRDIFSAMKLVISKLEDDQQIRQSVLSKFMDSCLDSQVKQLISLQTIGRAAFLSDSNSYGLLRHGDETIGLEAFKVLIGDCLKSRRKPTDKILELELNLVRRFIDDATFSGSVQFRDKSISLSRSFYDQIFSRLYHLYREQRKPQADGEAAEEASFLFDWLARLISHDLLSCHDIARINFGSAEFVLLQIVHLLRAFQGNPTLVGSNVDILNSIKVDFRTKVLLPALLPYSAELIECVGKSTFDPLRVLVIEILQLSQIIESSQILIDQYRNDLSSARSVNYEAAARLFFLHSKLPASSVDMPSILSETRRRLALLSQSFPRNLLDNNINGYLILLRFMILERPPVSAATLAELVDLGVEISLLVSQYASHPSPEGLNYLSLHEDDNDLEQDGLEGLDEDSSTSNQYILCFCWRAVKESSALLESIGASYSNSLDSAQYPRIVEHFISLLLTLRHRGAFSSLEGPLSTLLRCGYSFVQKNAVLQRVLKICLETDEITTTRRSAGLPHLILALMHSCARSTELEQLIAAVLDLLLKAEEEESLLSSTIHAFNILRALVRDSKVSNEMGPHVASIAQLCLKNFNSVHWSIRNASSMLLSSLITRVFGSNFLNSDVVEERCLDIREIEVKFPGFTAILKQYLRLSTGTRLEARLTYPLLAMLERIKIPQLEKFDEFKDMIEEFFVNSLIQPHVLLDGGRKLVHVAGRALSSLIKSNSLNAHQVLQRVITLSTRDANSTYIKLVIFESLKASSSECSKIISPQIILHLDQVLSSDLIDIDSAHPLLASKLASFYSSDYAAHAHANAPTRERLVSLISEELSRMQPNYVIVPQLIHALQSFLPEKPSFNELDIIYSVVDRFRLNEEILCPTLSLLCTLTEVVDDRFADLCLFYARRQDNFNIRHLVLNSLQNLKPNLYPALPQVFFTLLTDDDDEIRTGTCVLLSEFLGGWYNNAEAIRRYTRHVGPQSLQEYIEKVSEAPPSTSKTRFTLFEQEPLNSFLNLERLKSFLE